MGLDDLAGDLLGGLDVDRVTEVVDLVWDNKDDLLELLSKLPGLLSDAGEQMQAAGDGAQRASGFLSGDVQELTTRAADTLEDSQKQLEAVADALKGVGDILDKVPLMGDLGDTLGDGLKALAGVADNVEGVAGTIRGLGDRLGDVGGDLDGMGESLKGGGATLASLSLSGAGGAATGRATRGKTSSRPSSAGKKPRPRKG